MRQASNERIDLLKLKPLSLVGQLPSHRGNGKENQVATMQNGFQNHIGQDVVITNTQGDYLITKVTEAEQANANNTGSQYITTFECPLLMPGPFQVFDFSKLNVASTEATGGGGQANSLYRDDGNGWKLADTGVKQVNFQPAEGQGFTATLTQVERRIPKLIVGLTSEDERAENLAPAVINPVAFKEWACGVGPDAPANNLGTLQLNVALEGGNPPASARPDVSTEGPEQPSLNRFGSKVFEKLKPGLYNITARNITIGGKEYEPVVTGSPANIGNGRAATIDVLYRERRGIMTITVSGLPAGQTAPVRIRGRENEDLRLSNGTHPVELLPGQYQITTQPVGNNDATVTPSTTTIRSGQTSPVDVAYKEAKANVSIQVTGLPSGRTAPVQLGGKTFNLGNGSHTVQLDKGTYNVAAPNVGGYEATVTPARFSLRPRQTKAVQVRYAQPTGTMSVTVRGLSSGERGQVNISGPQRTAQNWSNGVYTVNLTTGNYTVSAQPVNGKVPTVTPSNVAVSKGRSTGVVVEYKSPIDPACDPSIDSTCTPTTGGGTTPPATGGSGTVTQGDIQINLYEKIYSSSKGIDYGRVGYMNNFTPVSSTHGGKTKFDLVSLNKTIDYVDVVDEDGDPWSCFGSSCGYSSEGKWKEAVLEISLPKEMPDQQVIYIKPSLTPINGQANYSLYLGGEINLIYKRFGSFYGVVEAYPLDFESLQDISKRYGDKNKRGSDPKTHCNSSVTSCQIEYSGGKKYTVSTNRQGAIKTTAAEIRKTKGIIPISLETPDKYKILEHEEDFLKGEKDLLGRGTIDFTYTKETTVKRVAVGVSIDITTQ